MSGPLAGVRIVDFSSVLMGPYATQILGDHGADVIKVESPAGDTTRWIGPSRSPGMGPLFLGLNRSKRSVAVELKTPEGREFALKLLATAPSRPAPLLGQHSVELLEETGYSPEEIERMVAKGAVLDGRARR